ncbi:MAG: hypothetical protein A2252_08500 [Elusimicrobia bacterium RIFOXYA2_FULL_39_19]|nr:MAG: hypothetical protein A2252_08500 [Elusimicrobia bacterium RIFOXYA2_FULL_39_19]
MQRNILKIVFVLFFYAISNNVFALDKPETLRVRYTGIIKDGLKSSETTIKIEAIKTLSDLKDKSSIQTIKSFLKDKSELVKIEAARGLSMLDDKSGIAVLIEIIKSKVVVQYNDPPTKRAKAMVKNMTCAKAVKALGETGDKASISLLKELSKDKDGQIKDAAIIALMKTGDRTDEKLFIEGLNSYEMVVRQKSCEVLGDLKEEKVKDTLKSFLKHWDKGVKQSACIALGKIGDKTYGENIAGLLEDKDEVLRMAAAESLGYLGDPKYVPRLREKLNDTNGFVRLYALESLYKLGDTINSNFIIASLRSTDADARQKAVNIMALYGGSESIEILDDLYKYERNELIRINIAGAIVKILSRTKEK